MIPEGFDDDSLMQISYHDLVMAYRCPPETSSEAHDDKRQRTEQQEEPDRHVWQYKLYAGKLISKDVLASMKREEIEALEVDKDSLRACAPTSTCAGEVENTKREERAHCIMYKI